MNSQLMNEREQDAADAIVKAYKAILQIDERGPLMYNGEELAEAVHVMQSFVKQHVLMRIDPYWSDWWSDEPYQT